MRKTSSLVAGIAWVAAGAICLFVVENIWLDARLVRRSHHRLPSLVPEALGGVWFMAFLALAIALVLAVFCLVILLKDAGVAGWKKALTGTAVLAALILTGAWFTATGGMTLVEQIRTSAKYHPVKLHWDASTSQNVRYNIYRGPKPGLHPDKLNTDPVGGTDFIDTTAEHGKRYYYVARAVDGGGQESVDSNETFADVP